MDHRRGAQPLFMANHRRLARPQIGTGQQRLHLHPQRHQPLRHQAGFFVPLLGQ